MANYYNPPFASTYTFLPRNDTALSLQLYFDFLTTWTMDNCKLELYVRMWTVFWSCTKHVHVWQSTCEWNCLHMHTISPHIQTDLNGHFPWKWLLFVSDKKSRVLCIFLWCAWIRITRVGVYMYVLCEQSITINLKVLCCINIRLASNTPVNQHVHVCKECLPSIQIMTIYGGHNDIPLGLGIYIVYMYGHPGVPQYPDIIHIYICMFHVSKLHPMMLTESRA